MDEFNPAKSIWLPRLSILILLHSLWIFFRVSATSHSFLADFLHIDFWILMLPALSYPAVITFLMNAARRSGEAPLSAFFRRPANLVSFTRPILTAIGVLIGAVVLSSPAGSGRTVFAHPQNLRLLSAVLVALGYAGDFIDGKIARSETADSLRRRATPPETRRIGPWLDAECDSLAVYFTSAVLVGLDRAPLFLLLPGAARYIYAIPMALVPPRKEEPLWFRWFSKTAAAFLQMLIAAYWIAAMLDVPASGSLFQVIAAVICLTIGLSFAISIYFRFESALRLLPPSNPGLILSWLVYYVVPFVLFPVRFYRMKKLYSHFVSPGDLVYDIGSHLGSRIAVFLQLGARVRAFEPQPSCSAPLNEWYAGEEAVSLQYLALGREKGEATMFVSGDHPTMSSLDDSWVSSLRQEKALANVSWAGREKVRLSTMQEQVQTFGAPAFTKIDVEGFELQVLQGCRSALPALSFEFLPLQTDAALQCIDELLRLGSYEFNFSPGESMKFHWKSWQTEQALKQFLTQYPKSGRSGDIYARLS